MNPQAVQSFIMRYLDTTGCHIIEKSPAHVTVKLSPEADKDLTGRAYYWSFVERTGAEPQTMSYRWEFGESEPAAPAEPGEGGAAQDPLLGRFFGTAPTPVVSMLGRMPKETLSFGSRRLEQLFELVKSKGKYIQLYEQKPSTTSGANTPSGMTPYTTWLGVTYRVGFCCDLKRAELHSFGISLTTGTIIDRFHERLARRDMSPRLPVHSFLKRPSLPLKQAATQLEEELYTRLSRYDYSWAAQANERLAEEKARIESYYEELLRTAEEEAKPAIREQYEQRLSEIDWQYRPRVEAEAANCGLYHLAGDI